MITQRGQPVPFVSVPQAAPAPTGGAVTPGTYALTGISIYTGVGGASGSSAISIAITITLTANAQGLSFQQVYQETNCTESYIDGEVTFVGASAAFTQTCPPCECTGCQFGKSCDVAPSNAYSTTATSFTTYVPLTATEMLAETYALQ